MSSQGVVVTTYPQFEERHSKPENALYVYSYKIVIENKGDQTVQLLSRHWIIRDGFAHVEHVVGEGVIGQQPVIGPGASYTYSSFCPLKTPTGSMEGSYQMQILPSGQRFDVPIPQFQLANKMLVN
jgi:ApaG protein